MRRAGAVVLLAIAVIGIGALLIVAATDDRRVAFTLGVAPQAVAAELAPGQEVCQLPVAVSDGFDGVRLQVGTYGRRGSPLELSVRSTSGPRLAGGSVRGGYPDVSTLEPRVGHVPAGRRIEACVRNRGSRKVAIYGGPSLAARTSDAQLDGHATGTDLALVFVRDEPRSATGLLGAIIRHGAVFKPDWTGQATLWLLMAAVFVLVPLLLAAAVAGVRDP